MTAEAGVTRTKHAETGWTLYTVEQGDLKVRIAPDTSCNLYSIEYKGQEILRKPNALRDLSGFMYGVPVLYPTPNRVKNAQFTFDDKTYKFKRNDGAHFLHGLVHSVPWKVTAVYPGTDQTTINCQLPFKKGSARYRAFPHPHLLNLTFTVKNDSVRFTYTVDNTKGDKPVPYGFALHPWFLYLGSRSNTYLRVPADKVFEADEEHIPSGKLLDVKGTVFDTRKATSLEGFVIDDVYFGLTPSKPTVMEHRDVNLKVRLKASKEFTHLVVYTHQEKWFCVENQTCSTDAHNLYAQGLKKESHLLIVPPGKEESGYIEFQFKP